MPREHLSASDVQAELDDFDAELKLREEAGAESPPHAERQEEGLEPNEA
jgi:hypothetical protein